ncbi:MAG: hypothetical protein K2N94_14305, partial [Lachnospiraceae bacterium]|nr:hypothetical protein [Lachnospiraceae bacterium]
GTTPAPEATATPTPEPKKLVVPPLIDYETLWLVVDGNGNQKVYYTDKEKSGWTEAFMAADKKFHIDISWLKSTGETTVLLKGDVCDEIVKLTLPAKYTKLKAKFNKANGTIDITNIPDGVTTFQWRKATSYEWHTAQIADASKVGSAFWYELEKMRVSGAALYLRLPPVQGKAATDGTFVNGSRPGKEIKVSVAKRSNAPKLKVDVTKLTVSTKKTMEYSLDDGVTWKQAEDKMELSKLAPGALGSGAKSVKIAFRTAATSKNGYSKTVYLTIPAQAAGPVIGTAQGAEVVYSSDSAKFYLTFSKASKDVKYEYTVVQSGATLNALKASWKAVSSSKQISVSAKTAPAGSTIYVRKKGTSETSKLPLELPSAMTAIVVSYTQSAAK